MCPRCRKPMVALELEGIEIDHCLDCHGVWLDAGELEAIVERAGVDAGPALAALQQPASKARHGAAGERSGLKCPRCLRRMSAAPVGEPSVELDRCVLGHGLWFDTGELQEALGRFHAGAAGAVARFLSEMLAFERSHEAKGDVP